MNILILMLLADTFADSICVVDNTSKVIIGDLPDCTETDTSISKVVLECDGFIRTFNGFTESPFSRDYGCTKFFDGANTFFIVEGLAFSSVQVICNDPENQLCGTDTTGPLIGGKLFPIDATSLLLAGAQSISVWIIPIVAGIIIGIVIIRRK